MMTASEHDIGEAINRLRSLHDGDLGVVATIACGKRAIPALRVMLFERESSGLFEARCRAVQVLAALNARDVLVEFLTAPPNAVDPVERLGDDAVINAAARAVAKYRDESIFQLLLGLARRRLLPGVVAAVGSFRRPEAIPYLIDALAEDECRPRAEAALERLGPAARPALMRVVFIGTDSPDNQSPSQLRQSRSALRLLVKMLRSSDRVTPARDR
jgi:hypothetical protein